MGQPQQSPGVQEVPSVGQLLELGHLAVLGGHIGISGGGDIVPKVHSALGYLLRQVSQAAVGVLVGSL